MQDIYTVLGYDKGTLEIIAQDLARYYITYRIKKRNGKTRRIDAPQEPLKSIQRAIVDNLLYHFRAHPIAHGFVHGKSPRTNAQKHVGKKFIVTLDIKDFFNSIKEDTVKRTMIWLASQQKVFSYVEADLELLSQLMCYEHELPQGAPTSPIISNLVCLGLDKKLSDLAKANNVTITRYADDIAISGDLPDTLKLKTSVFSHVYAYGLRPNKKKTKIRKHYQRQQITGVIVNTKTSIRKESWRNLRAQLHNLKRDGKTITTLEFQQLRGQIEWIKSLNQTRGDQLLQQLLKVNVV
jgi:RNA-directed DNA polymerase